ncbi:hypothetical protein PENSPDRAFT_703908 [Peniophora sp. CONT]|nr:hypothetical protein PENSPDRAFT_703908 [Peniophora sp. CONT]
MFSRAIAVTRTAAPAVARARMIHASPVAAKSVTESVADAAKKANKVTGEKLASGIDTAQGATQKTKETIGFAKDHPDQALDQAKQQGTEAKEKVKDDAANVRDLSPLKLTCHSCYVGRCCCEQQGGPGQVGG